MDPLSISASVITIAALASHIATAFSDLRTLCKRLPGRVHALSNEVSDLEVVLIQVAKVVEERSCSPIPTAETDYTTLPQLLTQAEEKLTELKLIVDGLTACSKRHNLLVLRARLGGKNNRGCRFCKKILKLLNLVLMSS